MIAIPSKIELKTFFRDNMQELDLDVKIVVIFDSRISQRSALIFCKDSILLEHLVASCNGRRFNSESPELCHIVVASRVCQVSKSCETNLVATTLSNHAGFEIPTCIVCLQRLDIALSGISSLSLSCSHACFCKCDQGWMDVNCRVCQSVKSMAGILADSELQCEGCRYKSNLWICMICSHIGCNRFNNSHAVSHFEQTQHRFSIDLANRFIWDYTEDCYVHRLRFCKNELGSIPSGTGSESLYRDTESLSDLDRAKLESLNSHYSDMLHLQLEKQMHHLGSQIMLLQNESKLRLGVIQERKMSIVDSTDQLKLERHRIMKQIQNLERQNILMLQKKTDLQKDVHFVKELNETMNAARRDLKCLEKDLQNELNERLEQERIRMKQKEVSLRRQIEQMMSSLPAD